MSYRPMQFNRMELAGSLGDLGTLLPITIGMIMVNDLSAVGTFWAIGLFYILAGSYFRVPISVQPMKVIGAYAIATGISAEQICASSLLIALILGLIGLTGAITRIGSLIPKAVVRGVQLSTGLLLMTQGLRFLIGTSTFQQAGGRAEPFFSIQQIGPLPIGILIGVLGFGLTFWLLNSRKYPAALVVIGFGVITSLILGDVQHMDAISIGLHFPDVLPYGFPGMPDLTLALLILVLPQIPMTIGNAIIASGDLSREYFKESSRLVTYRALTISMALAASGSFLFGGIPLCHGAGGLAAHYRFGARTAGSNLYIGLFFLLLGLFFGKEGIALLHLLPMSILGVLLIFAGAQLGLTIIDMMNRKNLFVVLLMAAITLATNLAWAFLAGILCAYALKSEKTAV